MYRAQVARFQARKQGIKGRNDKAEPNVQLQQVGQAKHLAGLDCSRLGGSVKAIRLDKAVLQGMQKSVEQVAERVRTAVLSQGRHAILFEINKKEVYVKLSKLFEGQIEDNIQAGYKEVYCKLLCFIHQIQDQDNNNQLLYKFIEKQGDLFNVFADIANKQVQDKDIGRISKAEQQVQEGQVDQLCLDVIVVFFDYQYQDMLYKSALISGLAVLGICKDSGQVRLGEYMPKYLAIIKIARMLVVYQSIVEQEDKVRALQIRMSQEAVEEAVAGLFTIVQAKVEQFITVVSKQSKLGVIDQIFNIRIYRIQIQFITLSSRVVDQVRDWVLYQRMQIRIDRLGDIMHKLVQEIRTVLGKLLIVGDKGFRAVLAIE